MKFTIDVTCFYKNYEMAKRDVCRDKRKAQKIANNVIRELKSDLPLLWESLDNVELVGVSDDFFDVILHFAGSPSPVRVRDVFLDDNLEIVQLGTHYETLEY